MPDERTTAAAVALHEALRTLGFCADPACEGTAVRVAELLAEFAPGVAPPPLECFDAPGGDAVILRDLPFYSLCAHHLLPFFGTADVAYRPRGRVAGLGAIARALQHFARRPQLQERLGAQLAAHLHAELQAPVRVRLRARQMCMEMRGARSAGMCQTEAQAGEVPGISYAPVIDG
jgi:GTP cyclohydrolase I